MDTFRIAEVSAAGMLVQKARIEAAAANLANIHSTSAAGAEAWRPLAAVIRPGIAHAARSAGSVTPQVVAPRVDIVPQQGAGARRAYEPGHPHADAQGMVSYPAVDHTREMMSVMTALRAYEANLAALQATKTLAAKALEIGGQ